MQLTYCKLWNSNRKKLIDVWSEAEAREAHNKGEPYCVLLGDPKKPFYSLDVKLEAKFVRVSGFDEEVRVALVYDFRELKRGQMFLETAHYRKFDGDAYFEGDKANITEIETFYFYSDGRVVIVLADHVKNTTRRAEQVIDVSKNWEPTPEFGDYESIARLERN